MQDLLKHAQKNGIRLLNEGPCQFCGSHGSGGVFECLNNVHHLAEILDFNKPEHYLTRFLSVDALALQHSELHGPWNNHIHLTRLYLIFEKKVQWDYSKTPQLSQVINTYKLNKSETLTPPPLTERGQLTTSDLLMAKTAEECITIVHQWAKDVFQAFQQHHDLVSSIAKLYLDQYPLK